MTTAMKRASVVLMGAASVAALAACTPSSKVSEAKAKENVGFLAKAVKEDVQEVRNGLPKGAKHLEPLYQGDKKPSDDLKAVRGQLELARDKVQDLRVAKSTFFALADPSGLVIRNDREQDRMAGKGLFKAFPKLAEAAKGKYVETHGSMPEAAGVKGPDGQWAAAAPVEVGGKVVGLYVTGWSWAAYAYRLENAIRDKVTSDIAKHGGKVPLLYVYVVVGKNAYGAPVSPLINAKAIEKRNPMSHIKGDGIYGAQLQITGRDFGLAVKGMPVLGPDVGVAVLRSET